MSTPVNNLNASIKRLSEHDIHSFQEMIVLYGEVFEMKNFSLPSKTYLENLLTKPDFIAITAVVEGVVIGGMTAYVLPSTYSESSEVYIYDLAVKSTFQRQGVGRTMIGFFKKFCRENNYKTFFVQADHVDEHAMAFYRNTGGSEEKVFHYDYSHW